MEKLIDVRLTESTYNLLNRLESGEIGIVENGETIYISKSLELDANRLDNNVFRETKETLKRKNIKIKIIPSELF